jgi:hypothetical protein
MSAKVPDPPPDSGSARGPDRRRRPTRPWDALRPRGRRIAPRRAEERQAPYYVDRFPRRVLALILALLLLTILDGLITLVLLKCGCQEANPAMRMLLEQGDRAFLLGKYALTVWGLPLLLIFQHHSLFRTRFRVRHLLPAFIMLYLALLAYQAYLTIGLGILVKQSTGKECAAVSCRFKQRIINEDGPDDAQRRNDRRRAPTSLGAPLVAAI